MMIRKMREVEHVGFVIKKIILKRFVLIVDEVYSFSVWVLGVKISFSEWVRKSHCWKVRECSGWFPESIGWNMDERLTDLRVRAACPWVLSFVILSWWPQFFIMGRALEDPRGVLLVERIEGNIVSIFRMKVIRFSSGRFGKGKSFDRCIDQRFEEVAIIRLIIKKEI